MKCIRISLVCMLCLLHLASAVCECSNGQESVIPSLLLIIPPSPFNGTDGNPSSFGSGCTGSNLLLLSCHSNGTTDNPLFDCSASNNSYYGWDRDASMSLSFESHYQSMNILVTFLVSTSSNVSAPMSLQYATFDNSQNYDLPADPVIHLPTNLPEGPYQHSYSLSSSVMFNEIVITITRNTTFQWVAINRIILCPVTTEDQSSSLKSFSTPVTSSAMSTPDQSASASLSMSSAESLTMSPSVSTMSSSISPVVSSSPIISSTMSTAMTSIVPTATVVSSSDGDDDLLSVTVIIGAVAGTLLLTIVIIIIIMIVMIVCRRRKESRRANDKNVQLSLADLPQQHTHNNSDKHGPTSTLETVNALYMSTKVKSLDSSQKRIIDDSRCGIGVTITPNPSYSHVGPNSLQRRKELEYDYVQTDDGLVGHDKVVTSGAVYDEVTDVTMDTVNIDPNPGYSVGQDVKLEDNPSYDNCNYSN